MGVSGRKAARGLKTIKEAGPYPYLALGDVEAGRLEVRGYIFRFIPSLKSAWAAWDPVSTKPTLLQMINKHKKYNYWQVDNKADRAGLSAPCMGRWSNFSAPMLYGTASCPNWDLRLGGKTAG